MKSRASSFRINDADLEALKAIGNGNRTRGIRSMLHLWRALGQPALGKDVNLSQVLAHYQNTR